MPKPIQCVTMYAHALYRLQASIMLLAEYLGYELYNNTFNRFGFINYTF